jgi:hypothetical protein
MYALLTILKIEYSQLSCKVYPVYRQGYCMKYASHYKQARRKTSQPIVHISSVVSREVDGHFLRIPQ